MERVLSSTVDVSSVTIIFTNLIFNMYQVLNFYKSIIFLMLRDLDFILQVWKAIKNIRTVK